MKKKLSVLVLALGLLITAIPATGTHAAELVNSTGSEAADITKGADITQGKVTEYYADVAVDTTTYNADSEVAVFVTKGSMIKISSPKTLILGVSKSDPITHKSTASGSYKIGLLGDMGGDQKIKVTCPDKVTLVDGTKSIEAAISAIQSDWVWSDVNPLTFTYANSTISLEGLTAGAYAGVFNINFAVTNN